MLYFYKSTNKNERDEWKSGKMETAYQYHATL